MPEYKLQLPPMLPYEEYLRAEYLRESLLPVEVLLRITQNRSRNALARLLKFLRFLANCDNLDGLFRGEQQFDLFLDLLGVGTIRQLLGISKNVV